MKKYIVTLLFCWMCCVCIAQKYTTIKGQTAAVTITSIAGHHTLKSPIDSAWIDMKAKTLYCRIALKDINFGRLPIYASRRTVVNRFLTSYLEMDRYPYIIYEASLPSFRQMNLLKGDTLMTTGKLTAHGITKKLQIPIVLVMKEDKILLSSLFNVNAVDDYKVRANTPLRYNYLNEIKVQVNAVLVQR